MSVNASYWGLGFVGFYVDISYDLNYPSSCIFLNDRNLRHNTHIDREGMIDFGFSKFRITLFLNRKCDIGFSFHKIVVIKVHDIV